MLLKQIHHKHHVYYFVVDSTSFTESPFPPFISQNSVGHWRTEAHPANGNRGKPTETTQTNGDERETNGDERETNGDERGRTGKNGDERGRTQTNGDERRRTGTNGNEQGRTETNADDSAIPIPLGLMVGAFLLIWGWG